MELAIEPDRRRPVRLDALKCFNPPHVVFDGTVGESDSTETELENSPLSRQDQQVDGQQA